MDGRIEYFLKQGYCSQYAENLHHNPWRSFNELLENNCSLINIIADAFGWGISPQGHNYWRNIVREISET